MVERGAYGPMMGKNSSVGVVIRIGGYVGTTVCRMGTGVTICSHRSKISFVHGQGLALPILVHFLLYLRSGSLKGDLLAFFSRNGPPARPTIIRRQEGLLPTKVGCLFGAFGSLVGPCLSHQSCGKLALVTISNASVASIKGPTSARAFFGSTSKNCGLLRIGALCSLSGRRFVSTLVLAGRPHSRQGTLFVLLSRGALPGSDVLIVSRNCRKCPAVTQLRGVRCCCIFHTRSIAKGYVLQRIPVLPRASAFSYSISCALAKGADLMGRGPTLCRLRQFRSGHYRTLPIRFQIIHFQIPSGSARGTGCTYLVAGLPERVFSTGRLRRVCHYH